MKRNTHKTIILFQILFLAQKISTDVRTGRVYHVSNVVMTSVIAMTTVMNRIAVSNKPLSAVMMTLKLNVIKCGCDVILMA